MIGAYIGRDFYTKLGRHPIHTNLYVMLIGEPAARKSTSIKAAKEIIRLAGYDRISAEKSSKEKFMLDLAGEDVGDNLDSLLDQNIWGKNENPCEMYIACDEFNDFIGNGNVEFISLLGNLWDFNGIFDNRIKSGKSVSISDPTISILGGNTPVNFTRAFPPDTLGQGFFSRLLLIYGESSKIRITWPKEPQDSETNEIVTRLQQIKLTVTGQASRTDTADRLLDKIYQSWVGVEDIRFASYNGRRFTHLLKLCLITSAASHSRVVREEDVIYANTILTHTEYLMPKALGEFGKSRNSDTAHKIVQLLENSDRPLSITEIWQEIPSDVDRLNDLIEIVRNLANADKIQAIKDKGFLAKKKVIDLVNSDIINYDLLTFEEREMRR